MGRVPVVDMRGCSDCGTCLELCPDVFRRNDMSGIIDVQELPEYPEEAIQEAINCCPRDCIAWDDGD